MTTRRLQQLAKITARTLALAQLELTKLELSRRGIDERILELQSIESNSDKGARDWHEAAIDERHQVWRRTTLDLLKMQRNAKTELIDAAKNHVAISFGKDKAVRTLSDTLRTERRLQIRKTDERHQLVLDH